MKYGILLFSGILLISLGSNQQVFAGFIPDPCDIVDCNDNNPCTQDSCFAGSCLNFPGNAGATCRAAVDTCDVAETCTGISSICPGNDFLPSGFTCRGAVDACDITERCTGVSPFCPGDGFAPNGAECGPNDACQRNLCVFGNCAGIVTDCNDLDTCTADSCDPTSGCVNVEIPACFPDNGGNGQVIGGEIIPIEHTSLILAGAQSFSWMIPVMLSGIGIGLFVVSRKSE